MVLCGCAVVVLLLGVIWLDGRYGAVSASIPPPASGPTATLDPGTRWYFQRSQWFPETLPPHD
jgi:hypothetical protein